MLAIRPASPPLNGYRAPTSLRAPDVPARADVFARADVLFLLATAFPLAPRLFKESASRASGWGAWGGAAEH